MTFLEHTLDVLADYGKNTDDIEWIGNDFTFLSWEEFAEMADEIEELSTDGIGSIPMDLKIVGSNWWLDLEELPSIEEDGEVQWTYREKPRKPLIYNLNDDIEQLIAYNEIADFRISFGELE